MKILERIDSIKMELQAAKQALHEADNWTVLATDLEEVSNEYNNNNNNNNNPFRYEEEYSKGTHFRHYFFVLHLFH